MCKYCKSQTKLETEDTSLKVKVQNSMLTLEYEAYSVDSSFDIDIKIKYCPMCGIKLES